MRHTWFNLNTLRMQPQAHGPWYLIPVIVKRFLISTTDLYNIGYYICVHLNANIQL
jgi:hypothetical protein